MTAAGDARGSGPGVARLYQRVLAAIFLVAWLSLASQVRLLVGSRGLLPLGDLVDAARAEHALTFLTFPSWLAYAPGDGALTLGTYAGALLAVLGLLGVAPRATVAAQTFLYLGYTVACRSFLGFQWDNLLLECGLLATFLPTNRRAPIAHLLLRALLFKLYFESGVAKWQSPLHDWQDGSAMTYYYETAPLPTWLAFYAHHLPRAWHLFESRAVLVIELGVPFAVFGPRRARLATAAILTLFQLINAATANYGFFVYLALGLHVFLLDDGDVERARAWLSAIVLRGGVRRAFAAVALGARRLRARAPRSQRLLGTMVERWQRGWLGWRAAGRGAAVLGFVAWVGVSGTEAAFTFGEPGAGARTLIPILNLSQTFRLISTYHLFAAVTRERIEPELQVRTAATLAAADGDADAAFRPLAFRYKPGAVDRAPPFVAPHQPRVDFLLWFYGLAYQRRQPAYVSELLALLCEEPGAVAALFDPPPPDAPDAVRIVFWDYRFASPAEKRATGAWWTRRRIDATAPIACVK